MEKETDIVEKQYQVLDKVYGFNKTVTNRKRENSDLVYNSFNFNEFNITEEEFNELSVDTKYKHLQKFFDKINECKKAKYRTKDCKESKVIVNDATFKLFNMQVRKLDDKYNK